MGAFINLRPCGEVVGFHLEIVTCCAGLDMRTWVHVYPRLHVSIVDMRGCQLWEGIADFPVRISCHIAIDCIDAVFIEAVAARCGHRDGNGVGICAKLAVRHSRRPCWCANGVPGVIGSGGRGCRGFAVFRGGNRQRNTVDLAGIGCLIHREDTISDQISISLSVSAVCNLVGNIIRLCNLCNVSAVTMFQPYRIDILLIRFYLVIRISYFFA